MKTYEIVRRTKEIFENFHGPNLKRKGVIKGLVEKLWRKILPGYNNKKVLKVVRLNTFTRSFRNRKGGGVNATIS